MTNPCHLDPVFCLYVINSQTKQQERHSRRWTELGFHIRAEEEDQKRALLYRLKSHAINLLLPDDTIFPVYREREGNLLTFAGYSAAIKRHVGFHLPMSRVRVPLSTPRHEKVDSVVMAPYEYPAGYSFRRAVELLQSL